jgi:hypothetical protein
MAEIMAGSFLINNGVELSIGEITHNYNNHGTIFIQKPLKIRLCHMLWKQKKAVYLQHYKTVDYG